jgi:hypothetical protein
MQGSVLSPQLFNVYLGEILKTSPTLQTLIVESKLLAFAEHLLLITDDAAQTRQAIKALRELEEFGLVLNMSKS